LLFSESSAYVERRIRHLKQLESVNFYYFTITTFAHAIERKRISKNLVPSEASHAFYFKCYSSLFGIKFLISKLWNSFHV